jgi:hypothetical protein
LGNHATLVVSPISASSGHLNSRVTILSESNANFYDIQIFRRRFYVRSHGCEPSAGVGYSLAIARNGLEASSEG